MKRSRFLKIITVSSVVLSLAIKALTEWDKKDIVVDNLESQGYRKLVDTNGNTYYIKPWPLLDEPGQFEFKKPSSKLIYPI